MSTTPRDSAEEPVTRVQVTLDQRLPGTRITVFAQSTHTAEQAAAAAGCDLGAIVKSLVLLVDGRPLLLLVAGDRQVSTHQLAARFGVGRKRIKMADAATVRVLTGFEAGAVSPIGHRRPLPALLDRSLLRFDTLWAAAGTAASVFPVTPSALQQITGAEIADLSQ